jgi:hypothetical protein
MIRLRPAGRSIWEMIACNSISGEAASVCMIGTAIGPEPRKTTFNGFAT